MTKSDNDNDVDQQHPMDDTAIGEATTTTSKPNDDDNRMIHLVCMYLFISVFIYFFHFAGFFYFSIFISQR